MASFATSSVATTGQQRGDAARGCIGLNGAIAPVSLGAAPENLLLSGSSAVNGTGNAADATDRIIPKADTGRPCCAKGGTDAAAKVQVATVGTHSAMTPAAVVVF